MKVYNFLTELKKEKCIVFVFVSLCAIVAGCKSDKDSNMFTAVTQGFVGGKDYMGGNIVYWSDSDRIRINDCTPTVVVDDADRHRATVDGSAVTAYNGDYYASYPAEISAIAGNGTITFDLPQEEQYVSANGSQVVHSVMAAKADRQKLIFHNLCAMLHFEVSASGTGINSKLYSIEVESDEPLWGAMTASYNGSLSRWDVVSPSAGGATKRTLKFSEPVTLNGTAKDFYLTLPPVSGGDVFTVRFILEDGNGAVKVFEKSKNSSYSFESGGIYHFDNNVFNGSKMLYDGSEVSANTMNGTEDYPYLVYSGTSWDALKTTSVMGTSGKHISLAGDISVGSTYTSDFKATLDGNGHTITLTTRNISVFSSLNGGQVRNVTVAATNPVTSPVLVVNGSARYYGALANRAYNSSIIENCVNNVNITSDTNIATVYIGGLCGNANGCTITNCRNEGTITSNAMYTGGVVGATTNMVAFSGCSNSGTITITSSSATVRTQYLGGVAGDMVTSGADITNCHNTGAISISKPSSAHLNCGGVFGRINRNVVNCSNRGNISYSGTTSNYKYIGGVVGADNNAVVKYLINCSNEGSVTTATDLSNIFIGGLLGRSYKTGVKNSYAFCDLQGPYVAGIAANGADLYSNVDVVNSYYYGTITCSTSDVYGIAGASQTTYKFLIDHCYYPSNNSLCNSSSTDNGNNATLSSAVSLTGGNSTSLRDALNGYSVDWPAGWLHWKNGTSPDRVVFDN